MEFSRIDISEMEKQRYEAIKKSGEYMELNVLIGVESEDLGGGLVSKAPVISTHINNCGPQEIGCMYMTLKEIIKSLEKKYPTECFVSKMAMRVEDIGSTEYLDKDEEE